MNTEMTTPPPRKKKDNVERVEEERDQVCWFERNTKSLKLDYSVVQLYGQCIILDDDRPGNVRSLGYNCQSCQ